MIFIAFPCKKIAACFFPFYLVVSGFLLCGNAFSCKESIFLFVACDSPPLSGQIAKLYRFKLYGAT
jgi:hypothetical protein